MLSDFRFALRTLAKTPGFVAIAIVTLALGIGANTAIFSVVNALLLRPLAYPDSERIVQVWAAPNTGGLATSTGGEFMDVEDHSTRLEFVSALHQSDRNLTGEGEPLRVGGGDVSANYLHALGINPLLGRGFIPQDDAPGGDRHVVIITNELWQSRFHGDPGIVGRAIRLDGAAFNVIGVLPPNALVVPNISLLVPATIRADAWKQSRDYNFPCTVIARLKHGASLEQATAELNAAKRALNASYPSYRQPWTFTLQTLHEAVFGNSRPAVLTLLASVALVLLIACANIANLLLARATSRQNEIAVRLALGATTGRIIRQFLTESSLLAIAGGGAGLLVASWTIRPLLVFAGAQAIPGIEIGIDGRVLWFTLVASVGTGLLFGLIPALSAARPDLIDCLKEGARGSSSGLARRLQSLLIIGETALTVVLLVCAGLLLHSFVKAFNSDSGFNRNGVLTFSMTQPNSKAPTAEDRARFVDTVLARLAELPGVTSVGMVSSTPMNGVIGFGDRVSREDRPATRNDLQAGFDSVAGDYFTTIGIPLHRGRFFTAADNRTSAPKVMIINSTLAQRLFGADDPIGQQLHFKDEVWEIVGVVGDVRQFQLDVVPFPQVYYPQVYFPWYTSIVMRTTVPPLTLAKAVRQAIRSIDPEQPIAGLGTLEQAVSNSLQPRIVMLGLLGLFAATALLLACIGIYGVMSYAVGQRTREMGIRIALGAGAGQVVTLILRDGLRLVLTGLAIGAVASVGAGNLIASQLYGIRNWDPPVYAGVAIALMAVALLACWLPARRATRVDPVIALRAE